MISEKSVAVATAALLIASLSTPADAQMRHGAAMRGAPRAHWHGGPHVNVNRNVVVAPGHPGYRPGYHPGYRPGAPGYRPGYRPPVAVVPPRAVWVGRPGWYRWAPGGAIAAGAAIGFVTAAAAAAYASAPPQPGLCWYYTDPSKTQGFWDACP